VTRGQTALTLTPREYGVLEFLLRHKGDVVTKSEILRSVWDSNYEGDDNVVEVYIGYCGARSTSHSGWSPSKRCTALVTGCSPTLLSPNSRRPNPAVPVAV
jgi:hypothetical protein